MELHRLLLQWSFILDYCLWLWLSTLENLDLMELLWGARLNFSLLRAEFLSFTELSPHLFIHSSALKLLEFSLAAKLLKGIGLLLSFLLFKDSLLLRGSKKSLLNLLKLLDSGKLILVLLLNESLGLELFGLCFEALFLKGLLELFLMRNSLTLGLLPHKLLLFKSFLERCDFGHLLLHLLLESFLFLLFLLSSPCLLQGLGLLFLLLESTLLLGCLLLCLPYFLQF